MKITNLLLFIGASLSLTAMAFANPIKDPIENYLGMHVPDRFEFVGKLESVQRVKIDVNGDGTDEIFIGTWYRHSGSKELSGYAGYRQVEDGYERITPANADVQISSFETIFAGLLQEISKEGMAIAGDIEVDDPESGNVSKVGMLTFYYIANGQLMVEQRPPLNLTLPADKAAYDRYFGKNRVTRKSTIETFSREQIEKMGHTIPNWEKPLP
jgi:hypothetical protein